MNFRKIYLLLFLFTLVIPSLNCGKEPVFTEMSTNRLKIVIKGTFENEGGANFSSMPADSRSIEDDSITQVTNNDVISGGSDKIPTKIMIDIAEIRLGGKKISNYRHIIEASLSDADDPFFNGTGIEVKTDDPGDGNYNSVELYIRKIGFDNAMIYTSTGTGFSSGEPAQFIFHEKDVYGFNFNQLMVNSYWDGLRLESGDIIRVFPMQIPIIGGLSYDRENDETVLEIRLVIKNFIKKYEYNYYAGGVYKVCHYYAPSDWLRDVREGETDIGRNLHAVARAYVPGKTGAITINSATGYVIAIPETENTGYYSITDSGINLRDIVGNADLPLPPSYPGSYIEPVLDYNLKYEKYKFEWNAQVTVGGLTLAQYTSAWDNYELDVLGDPNGIYNFGLKIPPYVAYSSGTSVTFNNMAPGRYKFFYLPVPNYGELFSNSDFTELNGGAVKEIVEGSNIGF